MLEFHGHNWETAGEVSIRGAIDLIGKCRPTEYMVGFVGFLLWKEISFVGSGHKFNSCILGNRQIGWDGDFDGLLLGTGRTDSGWGFLHVTFGCGGRSGQILSYCVGCETRPRCKLLVIDGFNPRTGWRAEGTLVQELDELCFGGGLVGVVRGM